MALTYYLTIDGLNGGSQAPGHLGAFEINGFDFDVSALMGGAGKDFSPLTVDLFLSSGLVGLLDRMTDGQPLPLRLARVEGVTATGQTVYDLKLGNVVVTEVHDARSSGGEDTVPDSLTFDYSQERAEWLEQRRSEFDLIRGPAPVFAARGTDQHTLALRKVSSAMHHGVIACHSGSTLRDVARTMANVGIHAVVVWGDAEDDSVGLWAIVSDLDLVAAVARGETLAGSAVGASRSEVVTIRPDDTLLHAATLMEQTGATHLVVCAEHHDRPVGVLSTLDLARALVRPT